MVVTERLTLISEGGFQAINITDQVRGVVKRSGIKEGFVLVFFMHTTGALLIVEHEAGMLVDLEDVLEKIVPVDFDYKHHLRGYDQNGSAHIRTALLNVSTTVPVVNGDLLMGTYQEILVLDLDSGEKSRTVLIQVMGE